MEELHIVLTPNKELEEVFPNVPVSGFRNGKSFKEFLVRARLPVLNASGRFEPYGKFFFFLAFYSISTAMAFTTEACQKIFEIHSGLLKWDSENVLYLLKC